MDIKDKENKMKNIFRKYSLTILIIPLLLSCQKEIFEGENLRSEGIHSVYTNEDYSLQILLPINYDSLLAYHHVYLLDGDWYFYELAQIIKDEYCNDIVLIGIGYKDDNKRTSDFTYPEDDYLDDSGNANAFIKCINNELIPFISDSLQIKSSQKTLAGHSIGGYLCLYLLFQNELNNKFDNIISASPSIWWHDAYLLDLEEQYNLLHDTLHVNLYCTMGDSEGVTMNTLFNALNKKIESRNYQGLTFEYERFENTTHRNNPIKSFEKGISKLTN